MWASVVFAVSFLGVASAQTEIAIAATPAVKLSKQKAVQAYPSLALEGSEFNQTFLTIIKLWKGWKPELLQRDNWPELAAEATAEELRSRRAKEKADKEVTIRITK